jgi:hypothetical protein
MFHPSFRTPYSRSYSVGLQRDTGQENGRRDPFTSAQVVDGRQRRTERKSTGPATGYPDEFKKAQANLAANIAARRGNTFA